jgi:hypothetical protein
VPGKLPGLWLLSALAAFAGPAWGQSSPSDPTGGCIISAEGFPPAILARVARAMGFDGDSRQVLRWRAHRALLQPYQSDRTYPPFFSAFNSFEAWFDPATGAERELGTGGAFPGTELPRGRFPLLTNRTASWILRDTVAVPAADFGFPAMNRAINPWAVISDFLRTPEVKALGRCRFRDYDRIALTRQGSFGTDTLLIDGKTWIPVGLKRTEPHYLWGQVAVEYSWTNWNDLTLGSGSFPLTSFRLVDGEVDQSVTITQASLLPVDSAPMMAVPDTSLVLAPEVTAFAKPQTPDTVRIGANAFLLVNRFYTTAAVLRRDTVFLLDATLSEARARQDSAWVARLFPGRHPIVLVVTDLAWPHIGGVRFWTANGATIVAHRAARDFLARVLDRRWTLAPDRLERERSRRAPRFLLVQDSLTLAGGDIRVYPIDGVASEVSVMAWLGGERFLWPGDYIQDTRSPSAYAREVLRATHRVGIAPERFAAQHVPLGRWAVIDSLHAGESTLTLEPHTVDGRGLKLGSLVRTHQLTRDGRTQSRGESTQQLERVTVRGRPLLVATRIFETPAGPAIDSSYADARTLEPVRHVGIHRSRTMVLEFQGTRVGGKYAAQNEPEHPIDHRMAARPFDSSLYDLVVAALPLREGYTARIPFYVYEQGGLVWYTVRVTGRETPALLDGTRPDAWAVDVAEDGRLRSRLWVAAGPVKEVLRSTFYFSGGEATSTR